MRGCSRMTDVSAGYALRIAACRLSLGLKQSIRRTCRQWHIYDWCFSLFCIYKILEMTLALGSKGPRKMRVTVWIHPAPAVSQPVSGPQYALLFMNPSSSVSSPPCLPHSLSCSASTQIILCTGLMEHVGAQKWINLISEIKTLLKHTRIETKTNSDELTLIEVR